MRTYAVLSALVVTFLIVAAVGTAQLVVTNSVSIRASSGFDYVLIILMENHPLNYSMNSAGIIGNPNAPYITSLAENYSLSTNFFALADGSLPNYMGLTDANLTSVNGSCPAPGPGCSTNAVNIVDRIENSGRTWKAYMEAYSGGCNGTGNPSLYATFHNPFIFYTDITTNSTRCAHIVSANSTITGGPDTQLLSDLNSTRTASNYMWLTPNECNNMHDTANGQCSSNLVANGDRYLSTLVPHVLNSTIFRTQRAALFIVWDEPTVCTYSVCPVPAIWAGPAAKLKYTSSNSYNHYSLLATLEGVWKLQALTVNDRTATAMTQFFRS